ncbi:MAG: cupin-like domain-containing protein [Solirubrobacteraceae bacterium]
MEFAAAFARCSIPVSHSLSEHPLFTVDAIAELADRLPAKSVRRVRGDLPPDSGYQWVDVGVGPPSETVRDVERSGVRIALRDIQQDPEYAELIDECLDPVADRVAEREGGMSRRAGYLFISCPASTTPMHFDVEHSFLLQVKGGKHVSVAAFEDSPDMRRREHDRWMDGKECDFEAMQSQAVTTRIEPGLGVYLPSFVPHWVSTEAGVSISFSIPFHTPYAERGAAVANINKQLRRIHLSPRPLGDSERVDGMKVALFRSLQQVRGELGD